MKRTKSKPTRSHAKNQFRSAGAQYKQTFTAHLFELRKRLFWIAVAVIGGGCAAYSIQAHITSFLLRPAGDQEFIYTSPGGGFSFLFNLCLYTGVLLAIPIIVYQLLRYLQPLIKQDAYRFIVMGSIVSGFLAALGVAFGYFLGLPAAMHFLLHQFTNDQIQALIAIQSYMSFVMLYLLGSALLFQVPLVMVLINRIKPLKPSGLMKFQRWFIVFAFVAGAIINPSPNIQDQLMLSVPMVLMYQLGIALVWTINKRKQRPKKVVQLMQRDAELRAARLSKFQEAQETWLTTVRSATGAAPVRAAQTARTWREAKSAPIKTTAPLQPAPRPGVLPDIPRANYQAIRVSIADS